MTRPDTHAITVMITGGHLTPALATIEEIAIRHPEWRILFAGRKTSFEGDRTESEEYRIITGKGLPFFPLMAGRVKRDVSVDSVSALLKIPLGLIQALYLLIRKRPDIIVSFGGYVAFPVAIAGAVLGIPVVTHEQTTRPGLANRLIARIARRVAVSFPETIRMFGSAQKPICTGLPVRKGLFSVPTRPPFTVEKGRPIIVIVGGSTGSVSINRQVFEMLPDLLRDHIVIHQTGRRSLQDAQALARSLSRDLAPRYIAVAYLSTIEYSWVLHAASFLIGRSGANTVYEAALLAIPAIWIPLPWAGFEEQVQNARMLEKAGTSLVLLQKDMDSKSFALALRTMEASVTRMKQKARTLSRSIPTTGARDYVDLIDGVLSGKLDA